MNQEERLEREARSKLDYERQVLQSAQVQMIRKNEQDYNMELTDQEKKIVQDYESKKAEERQQK